jgi:DNA adenine methylase
VPERFGRYVEPFVGGGALFFELAHRITTVTLGDTNERLVRTYAGLRDDVSAVVRLLRDYPYERGFYERMRDIDVDALDDVGVAAWMIYVNRSSFNGLYRVNKSGRFNVPFGRYDNPTICDEPRLRACSVALASARIVLADFEETIKDAQAGDLVYLDSPYAPLSKTSSFTAYTKDGFSEQDHVRLRDSALLLKERGAYVILSHSDCELTRDLYLPSRFHVHPVLARRNINSKGGSRGAIGELVIT